MNEAGTMQYEFVSFYMAFDLCLPILTAFGDTSLPTRYRSELRDGSAGDGALPHQQVRVA